MVLLDYLYLLKHCDFRYIKLSEGRGYVSHMLHVYIYLHLVDFVRANVGKYSSTMEHMGMAALLFRPSRCVLHSLWPRWLKHLRALGQAWKLSTRCQVKAEARHLNPQRHTAPHSATQRHTAPHSATCNKSNALTHTKHRKKHDLLVLIRSFIH